MLTLLQGELRVCLPSSRHATAAIMRATRDRLLLREVSAAVVAMRESVLLSLRLLCSSELFSVSLRQAGL